MSDDGDMDNVGPLGIDRVLVTATSRLPFVWRDYSLGELAECLELWTGWSCVEDVGDGSPDVFLTGILGRVQQEVNS